MKPSSLRLTGASRVVTGEGPVRGPLTDWSEVGLVEQLDLVVERDEAQGWTVSWMGERDAVDLPAHDDVIDLQGRLLVPGLVDAHTHLVFAGDRSAEFSQRMAGRSYAEIAAEGGGILTTVGQTRQASAVELADIAAVRLAEMRAWGARVVEIKTGYGLELEAELRLLRAIKILRQVEGDRTHLVATAMPAHAVPPEFAGDADGYLEEVCQRILPAMASESVRCKFVDIFIEQGYFGVEHAERLWQVARGLGFELKAHVDEFADIVAVPWAVAAGATSVEHLLATDDRSIAVLADSETVAVCLPLTSLFLREPYAPMRKLTDAGALLAVATDCNPGSAMSTNLLLAMQVAMLCGRLSPQECLRATTRCGALALRCPAGYDGRLGVGGPFIATLLEVGHPDDLFYELGAPPRASDLLDRLGSEPLDGAA